MLFGAVAGPLAGYVADITGGFESIWWPIVGILALAAALLFTTKPPTKRSQTAEPSPKTQ